MLVVPNGVESASTGGPLDPPRLPPDRGTPDPINIPSPHPDSVDDPDMPEPIGIPTEPPSDVPDRGPVEIPPESPDDVVF
jgi:hypothetical protein